VDFPAVLFIFLSAAAGLLGDELRKYLDIYKVLPSLRVLTVHTGDASPIWKKVWHGQNRHSLEDPESCNHKSKRLKPLTKIQGYPNTRFPGLTCQCTCLFISLFPSVVRTSISVQRT
jgi:hypothetical protein